MLKLLLIGLGGGLGSILRYALGGWVQHATSESFPTGTLVVNVTGCLAIGFLGMLFSGPVLIREEYKVAILIGILGGYTTFSTFGYDTFKLAGDQQWLFAGLNLVLSNICGLAAVWLGYRLAERWFGA